MSRFLQDVKYSTRNSLRNPGFTITVLVVLALGIGASTAIFSLIDTVLLKPLPIHDADRLVMLQTTGLSEAGQVISDSDASPTKFEHWRIQTSVLQNVAAVRSAALNYGTGERSEALSTMQVSPDFFKCWGIQMMTGRTFTSVEGIPNGPKVALITQNIWMRRFASDSHIVGKTIWLSGTAYSVVGVVAYTPSLGVLGAVPQIFIPLTIDPNTHDEGNYLKVIARLKPGITLGQAQERIKASSADYRAKFPNVFGAPDMFNVIPLRQALTGDSRSLLLILLGSVMLVLLIACANVTNLLLAQVTVRKREVAIRAALGARKSGLVRLFVTESLLLSLVGGGLGLLLGYIGIRAFLTMSSAEMPFVGKNGSAIGIDWRILAFVLFTSCSTAIICGIVPAIVSSRANLNSILQEGSGRSGASVRQSWARTALVASEVCVAVVLLIGSALLIRTYFSLSTVNRGFVTSDIVTMQTSLEGPTSMLPVTESAAVRDGLARLRELPFVEAATTTCCLPLQSPFGLPFEIVARPSNERDPPDAAWSVISPGYFDVFKIPIVRGRAFTDHDDVNGSPVVVISAQLAKTYWHNRDPLGDQIVISKGFMDEFNEERPRRIVGVVGDVRNAGLNSDPTVDQMMYVPRAQLPQAEYAWLASERPVSWAVRTYSGATGQASAIRDVLQKATGLPVSNIAKMEEVVFQVTSKQRLNMLLMSAFGCAALLLETVGIYGVMSYNVQQRSKEMGIRMALGAQPKQVRTIIIRQGMTLAISGAIVGMGVAWGLSRFIESLLFGVNPRDPIVFVAVPVTLCMVSLVAIWLPARRASGFNLARLLRFE
jgi:putative ABC transport system permease protein